MKFRLFFLGTRELRGNFSNGHITLHNIILDSNNDVRNLGLIFDQDPFFTPMLGMSQGQMQKILFMPLSDWTTRGRNVTFLAPLLRKHRPSLV